LQPVEQHIWQHSMMSLSHQLVVVFSYALFRYLI
jgi:hypothetical protein